MVVHCQQYGNVTMDESKLKGQALSSVQCEACCVAMHLPAGLTFVGAYISQAITTRLQQWYSCICVRQAEASVQTHQVSLC